MPRPPLLHFATLILATGLAQGAPPEPSTDPMPAPSTEVLGLTTQGALVFRRGATLFRVQEGSREASPVDTAPIGVLTPAHVGLAAPGGAAVVYPAQAPETPPAGLDAATVPARPTSPAIALDRPIRFIRVDGDGDDVLGELQPRCPAPKTRARPGRRRDAPKPVDTAVVSATLEVHVAWTARDVIVLGTVGCNGETEHVVMSAPRRPAIADGAHHAVAVAVEAAALAMTPTSNLAAALAALESTSPHRLLALAEAHAKGGDAPAAVSTLWRLSALGPVARAALDEALLSPWAATLEGRAAYHALLSSSTPSRRGPPPSTDGATPPSKDSP